jgi:flagellum-specific peptidoglycan hydrolase FlgJ
MKTQVKSFFLFVTVLIAGGINISTRPISAAEKYISHYKYIAISEMKRSGIPASIKLAQGLFESGFGKSPLAINANNHFGIKCKSTWTGATYFHYDDDYDTTGNLTASCFRSYNSPEDSYIDHTEFLVNRDRYRTLFKLEKTDYVAWANGLKDCGYATDPNYPEKLISTIKKFNLDFLDKTEDAELFVLNVPNPSVPKTPVIASTEIKVKGGGVSKTKKSGTPRKGVRKHKRK